eukprot:CAMPEP_0173401690 /NCGR_PEP_ID=MMETSP1356-20130122/51640_1 /TAXON_ID=77927 ORGANISM="Hemiselmis virescens, Strain PCC157" /NCGR_SAMPLE_ID=MMETSP1356 /ASSEMBLY_ACC=CAM_ASM_000847 /LENGTH=273 /DNA_ID=CAMNT_0014361887 /DNA_START=11 /DNA_END=832 /DNA_ORIENTATION=-
MAVSPECPPEERAARFQKEGCLMIRNLIQGDLLKRLAEEIDRHATDISPLGDVVSRPGEKGRFVQDYCSYHRFPVYREVAKQVAPLMAELMGSRTVRLFHDQLLIKEAGTESWNTHWHSDQPYHDIDGKQTISVWIPIDYVPRESSLEFVAESHLKPYYMPRSFVDNGAKWWPEGSGLEEVPDINADRAAFPIRGWDAHPGDALMHNFNCLHGSYTGSVGGRRVLSLRLLGDDIEVCKRAWRTVTSLANNVNEGKQFPVLWPPEEANDHTPPE